jgi:hypothetical protein
MRRCPSCSETDLDVCSAKVILRTRLQHNASPFNQPSRLYLTARRDFDTFFLSLLVHIMMTLSNTLDDSSIKQPKSASITLQN